MITDRREPGVYVDIEDLSYVAPTSAVGRSVFCVGVCDRGPHNRIVTLTSQSEFIATFGAPDFHRTSMSHYCMDKAMQYTNQGLYIRVAPEDALLSNCAISSNLTPSILIGVSSEFTFTSGSNMIINIDPTVYDSFDIGDWIYSEADTISEARQIIAKDVDTYTLDSEYLGTSGSTQANKYIPYEFTTTSIAYDTVLEEGPFDSVYQFYAVGTGKYYNNFIVKGVRNVMLEKQFVDANGDVKYKYLFMDIAIYEVQKDGTERRVEGPWTVSLTKTTPNGQKIRSLTSGSLYYIEDVINRRSELIRMVTGQSLQDLYIGTDVNTELARSQITLLLSLGNPVASTLIVPTVFGAQLQNGYDGTSDVNGILPLYDSSDNLYMDDKLFGMVKQSYNGSLVSYDGSVEQIKEVTYPLFTPDYVITGGWNSDIQDGGRQLADYRQDCFHIGDTGNSYSYEEDLLSRLNNVPWNNFTSMLYVQFRKVRDQYTGEMMNITPVYHAIERHLAVDGNYFLSEPVAGIEKGAISEPIQLEYKANHTERGDLCDDELNCTIVEPEGKYFLTQYTTWKRLSILKRAHAAKFVCFVRKMIPPLVKDLLQRKGTEYWVNQAYVRIDKFLKPYSTGGPVEVLNTLSSYTITVDFDEEGSELNIYLILKPLRVIERINVYIGVI